MVEFSGGENGVKGAGRASVSAAQDRRTERRHKVSGAFCILRVNGAEYPLEINDISEGGLQGETDISVHSGQHVEIVLVDGQVVPATVRWGVGPYIGVRFDHHVIIPATI